MPQRSEHKVLLSWLTSRVPQMVASLRGLVGRESPSTEKGPADACAEFLAALWRKRGLRVELLPQKHRGAHVHVTRKADTSRATGQLLVLGHYDTVYASSTLKTMPFRVRGGKAFGPGTFDMKGGIVQALFAADALQNSRARLSKNIVFLWTSDEEIGSESSRRVIETEAKRSDAVFVLEPALGPRGLLKTARKGVGEAELIVHGRSSHAGLAPEKGVNAIHELALQIARVREWNDLARGISINAGIVEGGTRSNVIPDYAHAVLDLRALRIGDMRGIEKRLAGLRPILRGAKLEIRGGFTRPPLEPAMSAELFARAKRLAAGMGLRLGKCTAGGGSDGNLTAALGVPTLDGLGAVGDGAHSPGEHIYVKCMPQRAALLAALLESN
jgi:glutamate carboxypeptidase